MSKFNLRSLATLFAAALISLSVVSTGWASHPYHVSKSEINWNPKSGNFEVAMCVWPSDLEKALRIQTDKPVDLDKVENLDTLLQSYVEKTFLIRKKDSNEKANLADAQPLPNPIRWVGHEKDNKEAWLYFEIAGDTKDLQWTIENRIFFELNEDQMNQLQVTISGDLNSFISSTALPEHQFETRLKKTQTVGIKMPRIKIERSKTTAQETPNNR